MRRLLFLLALIAAVGWACSDDGRSPAPDARRSSAATSPTATGPDPKERVFDPSRVELALDPFLEGLSAPLLVTHAGDGSGRLFVVEQPGTVRLAEDGDLQPEPFLDISDRIQAGGEQGLLGLAFHPEFEKNGWFFVNYTDTAGDTVVARYESDPSSGRAEAGSEEILLKIGQPFSNHNGGHLAFGPDGYLYIATGDGGGGGDPEENGQDTNALLGKLLRIDVDGNDGYEIPDDNPFADGGGAEEVWAYGLRNPWRFSFDEREDALWIGDVGQNAFEEINRVRAGRAGLNFGWNEMEASSCYEGDCDPSGMVQPITEYGHDHGCSVTGGFVYRSRRFPDMRGGYFFGDFCSGSIWTIDATANGPVEPNLIFTSDHAISSFGLDEEGEMYATDLASGQVLKVVDES